MSKIKGQNLMHLVSDNGKRTKCGLSNQYKDAESKERFEQLLADVSMSKFCCKKCK